MAKMLRDLSDITKSGLTYKLCNQGIIISDKVLIAKSKSRWKKLGEYDWHSYYGLHNLCDAIINNKLDSYAFDQDFNNNRKHLATVVKNSYTSNKANEKIEQLKLNFNKE